MDQREYGKTKLLYFGVGSTPSRQLHTHPFYQLELCLSGHLCCHSADNDFVLQKGDMWLIPPEQPHHFSDSRSAYEYLSLKFIYNGTVSSFSGSDLVLNYYMEHIQRLLRNELPFSPYSDEGHQVIENHLSGIMYHLSARGGQGSPETAFIAACRDLVCRYGYHVNVSFLAEHFHYTRSQLQYRFVKEHHTDANIKHFIEDILLNVAQKHLQYSAMSISSIAKAMNFPSVYAFSRFFKRKAGISPLKCRSPFPPGSADRKKILPSG